MLCYAQSVMSDSVTPWPVACQASLLMGFSRQEYWSRLPFPTPGDLPNPGIEPVFPALVGRFFFFFLLLCIFNQCITNTQNNVRHLLLLLAAKVLHS